MPLDTNEFVNELLRSGYTHLCVVPCSFAKNLINSAINNQEINYLPCASEAIACSIAAGLKMSGSSPIVIVQSSGLTNMGSCITSLLVPYEINFPIIVSWRTYKEGDSEIQHKHLAKNLPNLIESYGYEYEILNKESIAIAKDQIRKSHFKRNISILEEGTFSEVKLGNEHSQNFRELEPRSSFLRKLDNSFKDSSVTFIGTTGNLSREMYTFMKGTKNFYMAGNMGGALSVGLGTSLSGRETFVLGGDAEFVMHMGGLTTAGRYIKDMHLKYIVFDNQQNKSTGGQNTYQTHLDYPMIARASGLDSFDDAITSSEELISKIQNTKHNFFWVRCGLDEVTPRPPINVVLNNEL